MGQGMKRLRWVSLALGLLAHSPFALAGDVSDLHRGREFYVGLSPVSLFSFARYNHPFSLGYLVEPDLMVGVSVGSSKDSFQLSGTQYSSNERSVWGRYFLFSHLDVMARVRDLELNFSRRRTFPASGLSIEYQGRLKVKTLGLGVGGRWVWGNGLSVGADWLVANGIFHSSHSSSITLNEGLPESQAQLELARDTATVERFAGLPSVAVFRVGYVF